jgi:hypothetical protein
MTLNFYLKVPNIVHHQKVWQFCYFFLKKRGCMKHLQHSKYIDKVKTETKNKKRGEHQPKPSQAKSN